MAYIIQQSLDKKSFLVSQDDGGTFIPVSNIGVSIAPTFKHQDASNAQAIGLVQRTIDAKRYPNSWDFPGGRLDPGKELSVNLVWKGLAKEMASELVAWGVNYRTEGVEIYWPDLPELNPVPTELHRRLSRQAIDFHETSYIKKQQLVIDQLEKDLKRATKKFMEEPDGPFAKEGVNYYAGWLDRKQKKLSEYMNAMEQARAISIATDGTEYGLVKVPAKIIQPKDYQVYLDIMSDRKYNRVPLPMFAVLDSNTDFTALELVALIEHDLPIGVEELQLADVETYGELKNRANNFIWRRTALIDLKNNKVNFNEPGHPKLYSDDYLEHYKTANGIAFSLPLPRKDVLPAMFTSDKGECQLVPKLKMLTSPTHEFARDYPWDSFANELFWEAQKASGTQELRSEIEEHYGNIHRQGSYFWQDPPEDEDGTESPEEESGPDYSIPLR